MIAPTPFYSGRGTHLRILNEANALAARGHSVIIVTYHIGDTPAHLHPNIIVKRINRLLFWYKQRSSGPNWQKIFLDLLLFLKVMRIAVEARPDIFHCHLHEGVFIGWLAKKTTFARHIALVGDLHGPLVAEMRAHGYLRLPPVQTIFRWIEKTIHRMPNRVFASSPGLTPAIDTDRNATDTLVLSDAPTLANYGPPKLVTSVADHGETSKLPCIVYTGGFTPDKGLENLFQVITHSLRNGFSCQWVLAGSPLNMLSVPPEIKSAVRVISPLDYDNLPKILNDADVACEPKQGILLQGSGKLLNYMYAGVPPVCFDGPSQRFYLGEELASILIAPDIPGFYAILKQLVQMTEDEKARIKTMIMQRAKQFTWAQSARQLERCYLEQWRKKRKSGKSEL